MTEPLNVRMTLGELTNPQAYQEPIECDPSAKDRLLAQLRMMLLIRRSEEKIGDMVTAKKVVCPCHLAIGQEAIAVGLAEHLRPTDRIFGTHRSHPHFLALGGSVESLFAEVLGKATGCSHGMGGSMHLFDETIGFKGSVPIVAATVPMAVGAALAASMDAEDDMDIGVAFFGDGAIEEGSVHESMNYAGKFGLPMLFVVENNLFSSHLHINLRQPGDSVARFAAVNKLNYEVIDGNDVTAVQSSASRLIENARNGQGAGFLEAVTYRWRGHVGPREDNDVGLKRSKDLAIWKRRDPVRRLAEGLMRQSCLDEADYRKMRDEIDSLVESAWMRAEQAPYPAASALFDYLWAPPRAAELK